ncbi:unnamed protein product [Spirodela intermedia]|uniref:Uncharacterized protein n=1 Tax=Spirodela intermedia TaxID=51605 RepID=A0ABN7ECZ6_SPIIN|nr:unnamed protein product [Spirodela intermedia]
MHHPLNPLLEISEEESGLPGAGPTNGRLESGERDNLYHSGESRITEWGEHLGQMASEDFVTDGLHGGYPTWLCPMVKHVLWGVMLERYQNTKNKLHKPYELKMYACYTPDDFGFSIRLHILFHVFTEVRHPSKPQFLQLVPHLNWSNADLICHLSLPPASLNDPTQAAAGLILIN